MTDAGSAVLVESLKADRERLQEQVRELMARYEHLTKRLEAAETVCEKVGAVYTEFGDQELGARACELHVAYLKWELTTK